MFVEPVECIYLVFVGLVERLRIRFGIDGDVTGTFYVVKFGRSLDLKQRLRDHQKDYGERERPVRLMFVSQIRKDRCAAAEARAKAALLSIGRQLPWMNHQELVIVNPLELDLVKQEYKRLQRRFGPSTRAPPPPPPPPPGFGPGGATKRGGARAASAEGKRKKARL